MRPPGHRGADRIAGGGQPCRGDRGQVCRCRPEPQLGGAGRGDVGGELGREERALRALRDGPAKEPGRARHRQQRGDRSAARGLAEDGDAAGVAAERLDAVTDPLQGGDLVEQAPVGGRPLDLREALDAHAVVERHDDDAAVTREAAAVVFGEAGHADRIGATVDPDHHRQPRARARLGRPDVDRQPVVVRGVPGQSVHPERSGLRRRRSERRGLPNPAPAADRPRRGEATARRPAAPRTGSPERPRHPSPRCRGPSRPACGRRAVTPMAWTRRRSSQLPLPLGRSSGIDRRLAVARRHRDHRNDIATARSGR